MKLIRILTDDNCFVLILSSSVRNENLSVLHISTHILTVISVFSSHKKIITSEPNKLLPGFARICRICLVLLAVKLSGSEESTFLSFRGIRSHC